MTTDGAQVGGLAVSLSHCAPLAAASAISPISVQTRERSYVEELRVAGWSNRRPMIRTTPQATKA
jgi:hypothetical protein